MNSRGMKYFTASAVSVALAVTLWTSYETRRISECQTAANQQFLMTIKTRAALADGDREAVRTLVKGFVEGKTQEEDMKAVEEFYRSQEELDDLRDEFQYPDLSECE